MLNEKPCIMKLNFKNLFVLLLAAILSSPVSSQCVDDANIVSFTYDGKSYEVIKENKNWLQAVACAVERGGYLVEINDEDEQEKIFEKVKFESNIFTPNTTAFECGSCAYVWTGANDIATEGIWIWDGNNDASGTQFWMGAVDGSPVGDAFSNWGEEPDNFNDQDAAGLAINNWILGDAGQWNDVDITNELYFVIEYDMILDAENLVSQATVNIFPNPVQNELFISGQKEVINSINKIEIISTLGQIVQSYKISDPAFLRSIDVNELKAGVYFLNLYSSGKGIQTKKINKL